MEYGSTSTATFLRVFKYGDADDVEDDGVGGGRLEGGDIVLFWFGRLLGRLVYDKLLWDMLNLMK